MEMSNRPLAAAPPTQKPEEKKGIDLWVRGASRPAQLDDGDDERGARG